MSNRVLTWVFNNSDTTGGERLVLVALADYADASGSCFPSLMGIGKKAGMGERGVRKVLRKLEEGGHIQTQINRGAGNKNVYRVLMENRNAGAGLKGQKTGTVVPVNLAKNRNGGAGIAKEKTGTDVQKTGTDVQKNRNACSPKPSGNPQKPSVLPPIVPQTLLGSEDPEPKKRAPPKQFLPEDWVPSPEDETYAQGKGFSEEDIKEIAYEFAVYWSDRSDKGAKKTDRGWRATWRNWIRNQRPSGGRRPNTGARRAGGGTADAFATVAQEFARGSGGG